MTNVPDINLISTVLPSVEALKKIFDEVSENQKQKLGRFNIIVAGDVGAGKSTLINAVFGAEISQVDPVNPVKREAEWYPKEGSLRILDTRGMEIVDSASLFKKLREEVKKANSSTDVSDHIHCAWLCVNGNNRRIQKSHRDIARLMNEFNIPVIVVITQFTLHQDFPELAQEAFSVVDDSERQAPFINGVVPVRAKAFEKTEYGVYNLDKLVQETIKLLSDSIKDVFVEVQNIDLNIKLDRAISATRTASKAAAAVALNPVTPDILTFPPIQMAMVIKISKIFGIDRNNAGIMTVVPIIVGCLGTTIAGQTISNVLFSFLPGIGWIINSSVAASITWTFGTAYATFLYRYIDKEGKTPTFEVIAKQFPEMWRNRGEINVFPEK